MARRLASLITITLIANFCVAAFSAERNESQLELTTQRVIVFKDGYSLVIKRGVATTDKSGEVFTDEVPDAAVLGSFWAVPEEGRLISMLAGWKSTKDVKDQQLPCTQTLEILLANQGKQAKVELHDKMLFSGVIHEVLFEKADAPLAPAQLELLSAAANPKGARLLSSVRSLAAPVPLSEHTITAISGANFVLRTEDGDVLLSVV